MSKEENKAVREFPGNEYVLHINIEEIEQEVSKLHGTDTKTQQTIKEFTLKLQTLIKQAESTLSKEANDEKVLWELYKKLQTTKLAVLDLSHEYEYLEQTVKTLNPQLDYLIKDAIEEIREHINVLAESHRAHIDILEIYNTRKIEFIALVVTAVISYLAVWEFFVRDLIISVEFPYGFSPDLNYLLVVLTFVPIFITVGWAWSRRKQYF